MLVLKPANNTKGKAIPMPNDKNCNKLEAKLVTVTILAKNNVIKPGLQGITINPKNNPGHNYY